MDRSTYQALRRVLAYLVPEEARHWEEIGFPENLLYLDVLTVQSWITEHKPRRV